MKCVASVAKIGITICGGTCFPYFTCDFGHVRIILLRMILFLRDKQNLESVYMFSERDLLVHKNLELLIAKYENFYQFYLRDYTS